MRQPTYQATTRSLVLTILMAGCVTIVCDLQADNSQENSAKSRDQDVSVKLISSLPASDSELRRIVAELEKSAFASVQIEQSQETPAADEEPERKETTITAVLSVPTNCENASFLRFVKAIKNAGVHRITICPQWPDRDPGAFHERVTRIKEMLDLAPCIKDQLDAGQLHVAIQHDLQSVAGVKRVFEDFKEFAKLAEQSASKSDKVFQEQLQNFLMKRINMPGGVQCAACHQGIGD